MTIVFLFLVIGFGILVLAAVGWVGRKTFGPRAQAHFHEKWMELLTRVKTPEGMVLAVIDADKLMEEALRKKHCKGKTTGERLVSAQRMLSDNDAVWYAHKLRNRLVHEPGIRLKKREAQEALAGFKQGLHDLGFL